MWASRVYFSRMPHGRGVCRLASPTQVAAGVTCAGDAICQLVVESRLQLDERRVLTHAILGWALDGAVLQRWYAVLSSRTRAAGPHAAAVRVLLHNAGFVPLLVPAFVGAQQTSFVGAQHAQGKVRQEWWPAVWAHWMLVAPAQLINAFAVPRSWQVLVANTSALAWAVTLSALSHRPMGIG